MYESVRGADEVIEEMGNAWNAPFEQGVPPRASGSEDADQLVAIIADGKRFPALRPRFEHAAFLLEHLRSRDDCPPALAFAMPLLSRWAEMPAASTGGLTRAAKLARSLAARPAPEARPSLLDLMVRSIAGMDHGTVSSILGRLSVELLEIDPPAALVAARQLARQVEQAGAGQWSRVEVAHFRLRALTALGKYEDVLSEAASLRERTEALSFEENGETEVPPWQVREELLDAGREAAMLSEAWQTALDYNDGIVRSREARGVHPLQLARRQFDNYRPLVRLGRFEEARELLERCRLAFEGVSDPASKAALAGMVFSARADLEDSSGDPAAAVRFQFVGLQHAYMTGLPAACAASHTSLALYLSRAATEAPALAHDLAGALLWYGLASDALDSSVRVLADSRWPFGWPSFEELVASIESGSSVRFGNLFARLPRSVEDGDAAIAAVRELVIEARLGEKRAKARRSWLRRKAS